MKFGLIGYPIEHSLSPKLFDSAYQNGKDSYELIESSSFEDAFARFLEGYEGINVTAPFKELAYQRADSADSICKLIEASNLLIKKGDSIVAHNSDYWGVKYLLRLNTIAQEHKNLLVIGCSGAGKAAALAAQDIGFNCTIANRNYEKAKSFVNRDGIGEMKAIPLEEIGDIIDSQDVIIYAIPVALDIFKNFDLSEKIIIEANYRNPSLDNIICEEYINGKEWLIAQAITSFMVFTKKEPNYKKMREVLFG